MRKKQQNYVLKIFMMCNYTHEVYSTDYRYLVNLGMEENGKNPWRIEKTNKRGKK